MQLDMFAPPPPVAEPPKPRRQPDAFLFAAGEDASRFFDGCSGCRFFSCDDGWLEEGHFLCLKIPQYHRIERMRPIGQSCDLFEAAPDAILDVVKEWPVAISLESRGETARKTNDGEKQSGLPSPKIVPHRYILGNGGEIPPSESRLAIPCLEK